MKKWNWNDPITWKQSIIMSVIGTAITAVAIFGYWLYIEWDGVKGRLDCLSDKIRQIKA